MATLDVVSSLLFWTLVVLAVAWSPWWALLLPPVWMCCVYVDVWKKKEIWEEPK